MKTLFRLLIWGVFFLEAANTFRMSFVPGSKFLHRRVHQSWSKRGRQGGGGIRNNNPRRNSNSGSEDSRTFKQALLMLVQGEEYAEARLLTFSFAGAMLIRSQLIDCRSIVSESMAPTFVSGDRILVDKRPSSFIAIFLPKYFKSCVNRGTVIVFKPPDAALRFLSGNSLNGNRINRSKLQQMSAHDFTKRVIGIEGDVVEVNQGVVFVNGKQRREESVLEPAGYEWGPVTVPEGSVVVFGDNRNLSLDSHIWGMLDTKSIIGKVICIYWPPNRVKQQWSQSRRQFAMVVS